MANRNLLQEAIADAKTIKETAIENAKQALEETFTPYLKEKLSAKLAEMDNEETELDENEDMGLEDSDLDELLSDLNEEETEIDETKKDEESEESEEKPETEEDEEIDLENITPEELKSFVEDVIQDMVSSGDLQPGEGSSTEESSTEEEIDETEIEEYDDEHHMSTKDALSDEDDEELDLDELLEELKKSKTVQEVKKPTNNMGKKLNEALNTINILKKTLNEVNLFNAQLLFSNKIFKAKQNLNEGQKVKILKAFDKTKTKKEAELVYETLMESFKTKKPLIENKKPIGSASKIVENMNIKTPIIESSDVFSRMKELAGIK